MLGRLALLSIAGAMGALSLTACKRDPAPAPSPGLPPPAVPSAPSPAPSTPAADQSLASRVEVAVTEEGFVPSKIPAKAGQPITLAITRKAERTCATEILFQGQEKKTDLPLNKTVEVSYTPTKSGDVKFGCAMGMMIGGVLAVAE